MDIQLFSDMHKDAYGRRPTAAVSHAFETLSPESQDASIDEMQDTITRNEAREQRLAHDAVVSLREQIESIINLGEVGDISFSRTDALRWMTAEEDFVHDQDVEHWVWQQGVLFTDYGKALVKELCAYWKV